MLMLKLLEEVYKWSRAFILNRRKLQKSFSGANTSHLHLSRSLKVRSCFNFPILIDVAVNVFLHLRFGIVKIGLYRLILWYVVHS